MKPPDACRHHTGGTQPRCCLCRSHGPGGVGVRRLVLNPQPLRHSPLFPTGQQHSGTACNCHHSDVYPHTVSVRTAFRFQSGLNTPLPHGHRTRHRGRSPPADPRPFAWAARVQLPCVRVTAAEPPPRLAPPVQWPVGHVHSPQRTTSPMPCCLHHPASPASSPPRNLGLPSPAPANPPHANPPHQQPLCSVVPGVTTGQAVSTVH